MFGSEPTPSTNPRGEIEEFVSDFESNFGTNHPQFLIKSYDEVCYRKCVFLSDYNLLYDDPLPNSVQ